MRTIKALATVSLFTFGLLATSFGAQEQKPNLLIIHTDEHSFRTLGCYRDLMSKDQAEIWGEGNVVETPNIDSIADQGAIAANYYASSPVCTPSRASLITGLYPQATG
ncbi:MAG: sulfatase-like hydrolase/transferase, partial [Opitutaceae bacterium]